MITLEKSTGQINLIEIPIQNVPGPEIQIPELYLGLKILNRFQIYYILLAIATTQQKNASTQLRTLQHYRPASLKFGNDFLKHSQDRNNYIV